MSAAPSANHASVAPLPALLAAVAGVLALATYPRVAAEYYGSTAIPQGLGMAAVMPAELAQLALFVVFGGAALLFLTIALTATRLPAALGDALVRAAIHPRRAWLAAAAVVLAGSALVGRGVLQGQAVSDDEHAYQLAARTLRMGHLVAPSPGSDLPFYAEHFVVLTDQVRFAKYPIGHPLLLAAGEALGLGWAVVPALSALIVVLAGSVAARVFGPLASVLTVILLASSPQLLLTGGTLLSQPASAACLLASAAALLRAPVSPRPAVWCALAGAASGFAVLVRPAPGAAFAAAACVGAALLPAPTLRQRLLRAVAAAIPVVGAGAGLLLVNRAQTGALMSSGFHLANHLDGGASALLAETAQVTLASAGSSVFAAVARTAVWLTGWPGAILLCALAPRTRLAAVPWAVVAVTLVYRIAVPKAGVSPTGPVYVYEAVPFLALLCAGALARALEAEPPRWSRPALALALAGLAVNLALFLPARLADLADMGAAQQAVFRELARQGAGRALVFHYGTVPPWTQRSWAYFPPCNGPALDDDVLFVRWQGGPDSPANVALWRRRYPERSAWVFRWPEGGRPQLTPLAGPLAP